MLKYRWIEGIILVLLLTSICYSQQYFIGGGISYATENDNADGGTGFNAFIDYSLSSKAFIKGSIGTYSSDTKADYLSEGDYSLLWLEGSLLATGTVQKVKPYGGAGGGYYLFEHELSPAVESALLLMGFRATEDIQNTFGIHVRGGFNIELSPTVMLNMDIKYNFLKPNVEVKVTELESFNSVTEEEEIDLNTLIISIGLKVSI